jgi:hypothetical protein
MLAISGVYITGGSGPPPPGKSRHRETAEAGASRMPRGRFRTLPFAGRARAHKTVAVNFRPFVLAVAAAGMLGAQDCTRKLVEDFVPMTRSVRLVNAGASVFSAHAFLEVGVRAASDGWLGRQREWGSGADGFGRRYAGVSAEHFIQQSLEQSAAYWRHQDNRYFAMGRGGLARRLGYSAASTLLARRDDGSRVFSYTVVGGAAAAPLIARAWQPRSTTTFGDAAVSFGLTMGIRGAVNIAREFAPRCLRFLLR